MAERFEIKKDGKVIDSKPNLAEARAQINYLRRLEQQKPKAEQHVYAVLDSETGVTHGEVLRE